jgi:FtsH-binding integral membrane protein
MIRHGFIRKVYGILTIQLLATVLICTLAMVMTSDTLISGFKVLSFGSFVVNSSGLQMGIYISSMIILFMLLCLKNTYPANYILLSIWTVALAFTVATACVSTVCDPMVTTSDGKVLPLSMAKGKVQLYDSYRSCAAETEQYHYGMVTVLMALGITASLFLGLTIFTFQSKWNFSFLGAGLAGSLWILLIWGFVMMFFGGGPQLQYLYRWVQASNGGRARLEDLGGMDLTHIPP